MRSHQDKFFTGGFSDYIVAAIVAFPLSLLAAFLFIFVIGNLGWFSWFITFSAAPIASGFIAEAVRWGVRKRHSRYLAQVVVGCLISAIVPFMLFPLLFGSLSGDLLSGVYGLVEPGILLVVGSGTLWARLH